MRESALQYLRKIEMYDPNGIYEMEKYQCRTSNDYVDWNTLSGEVITYNIKDKRDEDGN